MDVSGVNGLQYDEEKALNSLLDTFSSVFSLEDIASAYCKAGRNADLAVEILCRKQGSTSSVATDASNDKVKNDATSESSCGDNFQNKSGANGDFTAPKQIWQQVSVSSDASNGKVKKDEPSESSSSNSSQNSYQANGDLRALKEEWRRVSAGSDASNGEMKRDETSESSCSDLSLNSYQANGELRAQKQKWRPVSGGTVSSMLGKGYMKSVPLPNAFYPGTKPLKVDPKELPMSVLWGEGLKSSSLKQDRLHKDMEDFLYKMLGEGFRLERDMIREVLDSCGYDMQKSMEKLLDQSARSMDKECKFLGESSKKTNGRHPRAEGSSEENGRTKVLNANCGASQKKDRNDFQKEVLAALFNGSERFDELPRRKMRSARRPIALGELVEGPLIDFTAEQKVDRVCSQEDKEDGEDEEEEEEEDSFQALRKAVKEHRSTMKEYYEAAIDAFAKADKDLAERLLEQGESYRKMARQADEESNEKIFETRYKVTDDEMFSLELHKHEAKEAIRLLKFHLTTMAGIPSFKYLKLIVETNEEDTSNGRRKRLVMKLLEKESISWIEGETCGIVLIPLDTVNPKKLSFAKK